MIKSVRIANDIMVKGFPATAGSKALQGFTAPFSATVAERLGAAGVKTDPIDCFAEFSFFDFLSGKEIAFPQGTPTLCNDYCGAHKFFAAKNGMFFLHPTYGRISRYGLVQAVSSMDQIGIAAENLRDAYALLEVISGKDEKDIVTVSEKWTGIENIDFSENTSCDEEERNLWAGVFFILASSELSCNIARYDGVKFGRRAEKYANLNEMYLNSRKEGFSTFIKTAAVAGTAFLSKDYYADYYEKALRLRRFIKEKIEKLLAQHGRLSYGFDLNEKPDFGTMGLFSLSALTQTSRGR